MRRKTQENWAGVVKALGLRSLSSGKFWQFCFLVIIVAMIWRIESTDWVKIADLLLRSRFVAAIGWFLWVGTIFVAIMFHKIAKESLQFRN